MNSFRCVFGSSDGSTGVRGGGVITPSGEICCSRSIFARVFKVEHKNSPDL